MSQESILVLAFGILVAGSGIGVLVRGILNSRKMRRELESGHPL